MKFRRKKKRSKYTKTKQSYSISTSAFFINFLDPYAFYRVMYFYKDGLK